VNTPLMTPAPGVLANDSVNAATIVSYGASTGNEQTTIGASTPTTQSGAIVLNADGSFTYTPPAAFTGTGIDPDGDALTYGWAFSDSSSSNSAGVAKTFASPGTYTGTVTVTDPTGQHASVVKTVSVIDDPPTDIAISPATVAENQPAGTTVGALGATDLTQGDTQTFALVNGAGADDNAAFTLAGGELRTAGSFDLEQKASYTVRVHVVDGAGETFEKPLTIAVGNVNEPPTDIALSAFFVPEGKPVGTAVAKLIAVDVDAGDPHTFSLVAGDGSADNSAFAVDGGVLRTATTFNAKKQPSYSIRVRTVDSGAIPLAVETQFTLTVADSTRPSGSIARMSGQTVRSVLAKGLHATLVVTEPSTAALSVLLDGATRARTSRLLARRAFSIPRKDKATVTVRLSPKAKRLLRRTRRPRLTLRVLLTDRAGNQRRIARRISLRR
jgi:PKD domain.